MLTYDKAALKKILVAELGWYEKIAETVTTNPVDFRVKLQAALNAWLADRSVDDEFRAEGVPLGEIMTRRRCSCIDAMALMTVFINKPEPARQFTLTVMLQ